MLAISGFFASGEAGFIFREMLSGGLAAVFQLLLTLLIIFGFGYGFYVLFSLPQRRLERASIFLNVVDSGIRRGLSPEDTIKSIAACQDVSVSVRFHLLAAWIERGSTWREALGLVPRLLPPAITQMLLISDRLGGWDRVFPLCKRKLIDVRSQMQARQGFLSPSAVLLPLPLIFISFLLMRVILPKFQALALDMGVPAPAQFAWLLNDSLPLFLLMMLLALLPVLALLLHVAGPRLFGWFSKGGVPFGDYLEWLLPWHKLRVQRDFVSLLGLLLDAGVNEKEAVEMAAKGTANSCCMKAAQSVTQDLGKGIGLTEALAKIDDHGEFKWRFEQAAQGGAQFETALNGWCDALTGRADQWQQTVTHVFNVTILLVNALLVGMIAFGLFGFLLQVIDIGME